MRTVSLEASNNKLLRQITTKIRILGPNEPNRSALRSDKRVLSNNPPRLTGISPKYTDAFALSNTRWTTTNGFEYGSYNLFHAFYRS